MDLLGRPMFEQAQSLRRSVLDHPAWEERFRIQWQRLAQLPLPASVLYVTFVACLASGTHVLPTIEDQVLSEHRTGLYLTGRAMFCIQSLASIRAVK